MVTVVQQALITRTAKEITMIIVGQVSSKEEAKEITFIAKLFVVGQRARVLAQQNEDK